MIFHSETAAFDHDGFSVVKEAVQHGRGDGAVVIEDRRPLFEGFVGGQDDGAAFIALADGLEEQIGAMLIDGQIADFIQNQDRWSEIFFELHFEAALFLGGGEFVDDVDRIGKEHRVAFQAGGVAQRGSQVGFAQPDGSEKDDVGRLRQELQAEEVLNLEAIDFLGPIPMELLQRFDDRKACGLDAQLDTGL